MQDPRRIVGVVPVYTVVANRVYKIKNVEGEVEVEVEVKNNKK